MGSPGSQPGRRSRLTAALGFVLLERGPRSPAIAAVHGWLDSWRGLGDIVTGMLREGFEFNVTAGPDGWAAYFFAHRARTAAPRTS